LIRYNERANVFVPTAEFEQSSVAHAAIDEFEDHIFWDELISQLTVRDAARIAGGMDRLNALSDSDRQAVEGPIRRRYIEEFSANGAANLSVIQQFVMNAGTPVRTSD
jgi:glycerol kinase